MKEVAGSERMIPCELALLAAGFLHPQQEGLLNDLGWNLTSVVILKPTSISPPPMKKYLLLVTAAVDNHWWCGPSAKDVKQPAPWTNT